METAEALSDTFIVRWDEDLQSLLIVHPDGEKFPHAHIQIRSVTLEGMNWREASQFIGERLILLIPALRARYVDPATGVLRGEDAT